jgi:hypothetical protein
MKHSKISSEICDNCEVVCIFLCLCQILTGLETTPDISGAKAEDVRSVFLYYWVCYKHKGQASFQIFPSF